jgi:DNA-binding transcriptional LysR family regulator
MDVDLLPTLVALHDLGSLTAAGRRLGLSQPAVHQQLARLAEQVGLVLYRREGRRVELTAAGLRLAALGREVEAARRRALADLGREREALPVVAAGEGVWQHLVGALPPCVPRVLDGPAAVRAVQDGVATVAIAAIEPPEGLRWRELRSAAMVVVGLPGELPDGAALRWEQLRDARWVLPPRGRPVRELVEAHAGPCQIGVEAEGWALLTRFVALGAGISVVNDLVALPAGLVSVPVHPAPPVIYRAIWRPGAEVEALLGALRLVSAPGAARGTPRTGPPPDRA